MGSRNNQSKAVSKSSNFMRSLCVGEILQDMIFPFPSIKEEEQEVLRATFDALSSWLGPKEQDFRKWDVEGHMPKEVIEEMKEFGLFGLIIPESYGGMGLSSTAYSRVLQEMNLFDGSVALTVGAHSSIGMRGLLLFGTEEQKNKYLPKLTSGEMIAAFCLTEPGAGSDAANLKTKAIHKDGKWILNGEKIWITNGGIADFFTVFAKTDDKGGHMTAFIVTRDMAGVSTGPHEDKMGIRASSTTSVFFKDVVLDDSHVIGEIGKGFKAAMKILNSGRTGLGGGCVGGMKKLIKLSTAQATQRVQFGQPIAEFGLIKQKIGNMVVDCYASEAVVSMVGGFVDQGYEDYAVEAAISKVFATERLWACTDEALQIAGGNGYMREFPYERMMRDFRINRIFEGTNDILRLFIALTALNDVGIQLKEVAQSLGNVLADPIKGFGVLSDYAKRRMSYATGIGTAQLTKAHPKIRAQAQVFEECTAQLASAADRILRKHGKNIVGKQFASKRMADIMIDMFVLSCVISRVSKSIEANGEDKAKKEMEILEVFAGQVKRRVRSNFGNIDENDDELLKGLAVHACEQGKYIWDTMD